MTVKIAVVQQNTVPGAVERNRARALDHAREALTQDADIILFHEELLVGYYPGLRELAEPVDGPTTRAFQSLLRGSDALIIYGLTEREGDDCYISGDPSSSGWRARQLSQDAPVVGCARPAPRTHLYRPGNRLVTFMVKGYRCGIMICYDGDFPEMTRAYANLGCAVLFWMNNRNSRGQRR